MLNKKMFATVIICNGLLDLSKVYDSVKMTSYVDKEFPKFNNQTWIEKITMTLKQKTYFQT